MQARRCQPISKVLRTLKHTEDATAEPATANIYLLCNVGLALAAAIVERHSPGGADGVGKFPGNVPLPRSLFRQLDSSMLKGARAFLACDDPPGVLPS